MLNLNLSARDPLPTCLREARHNGARTTVQRTPFVATIGSAGTFETIAPK
jgi:hypothetical protein